MSSQVANLSISCNEEVNVKYEIVGASLCSALCLFGLMYTFFGYRCFKAVMFLSGVIFGSTAVYLICREERIFQQETSVEIAAGISVGIGILCGFITMLVRYVGLFLQGFFLGVLVAIATITALQLVYCPSTLWITFCILFFTGVFFSFLTLKYERCLVIIGTSVLGSGLIVTCIDYFLENFRLLLTVWEELMMNTDLKICWFSWIVFGVWPLLSVLGVIVQYKVTGKGYDHTDVIIVRGRRKRVRTHLIRAQHDDNNQQVGVSVTSSVPSASRHQPSASRHQSSSSRHQSSSSRHQSSSSRHQSSASRHQSSAPAGVGARQPSQRRSRSQRQQRAPSSRNATTAEVLPSSTSQPPSYRECIESGLCEPLAPNRHRSRQATTTTSIPFTTTSNERRGADGRKRSDVIAAHAQRLLAAVDHRKSKETVTSGGRENPAASTSHMP